MCRSFGKENLVTTKHGMTLLVQVGTVAMQAITPVQLADALDLATGQTQRAVGRLVVTLMVLRQAKALKDALQGKTDAHAEKRIILIGMSCLLRLLAVQTPAPPQAQVVGAVEERLLLYLVAIQSADGV